MQTPNIWIVIMAVTNWVLLLAGVYAHWLAVNAFTKENDREAVFYFGNGLMCLMALIGIKLISVLQ